MYRVFSWGFILGALFLTFLNIWVLQGMGFTQAFVFVTAAKAIVTQEEESQEITPWFTSEPSREPPLVDFFEEWQVEVNKVPSQVEVNKIPSQVEVNKVPSQVEVNKVPSQVEVNKVPSQEEENKGYEDFWSN